MGIQLSEAWLREWVGLPATVTRDQLCEKLTLLGHEVEQVTDMAAGITHVVVGQVVSVCPHPNASRLTLCTVDVGEAAPLDIVCGAKNIVQGGKYPVAKVGATLPGGVHITAAKLRGVTSHGMLCAASELGLATHSQGIMQLSDTAEIGMCFIQHAQLNDSIMHVDITPNRGDCLSIRGIARDVAAGMALPYLIPSAVQAAADQAATLPSSGVCSHAAGTAGTKVTGEPLSFAQPERVAVHIHPRAKMACERYYGAYVHLPQPVGDLPPLPVHYTRRLTRSGMRTVNPVVDVLHYVMLELGQPLHAFDAATLQGTLTVRFATPKERVSLLNGQTVTQTVALDDTVLVVADEHGVEAVAGIMGADRSAVRDHTRALFIESASFDPRTIGGTARRYHWLTDAAQRFERGVDPTMAAFALVRVAQILQAVYGAQWRQTQCAGRVAAPLSASPILLEKQEIKRIVGFLPDDARVVDQLTRLGCVLSATQQGWQVAIPAHRFDLHCAIDLIEEVVRLYGYESLPPCVLRKPLSIAGVASETERAMEAEDQWRMRVSHAGYQEVLSFTFVDPEWQAKFFPDCAPLQLSNPISQDLSVMRVSLWPGLLKIAIENKKRQQQHLRLFEIGPCFTEMAEEAMATGGTALPEAMIAKAHIAGVMLGDAHPEQWGLPVRALDFYDVKGEVTRWLQSALPLHGVAHLQYEKAAHPMLHPGQAAQVLLFGQPVGWVGSLHPRYTACIPGRSPTFLFSLCLSTLTALCHDHRASHAPADRGAPSAYPAVRRDLAFLVNCDVAYHTLHETVIQHGGPMLRSACVFDVYVGDAVPDGKKSIAMGLLFQDRSRTLKDEQVDIALRAIISALRAQYGAVLRDSVDSVLE